jgi:hypothetical protein
VLAHDRDGDAQQLLQEVVHFVELAADFLRRAPAQRLREQPHFARDLRVELGEQRPFRVDVAVLGEDVVRDEVLVVVIIMLIVPCQRRVTGDHVQEVWRHEPGQEAFGDP